MDLREKACIYVSIMNDSVVFGDITGRCRSNKMFYARSIVSYMLHEEGMSYSKIGNILHRDHSSIVHSVKTVKMALKYPRMYPDLMLMLDEFQSLLNLKNSRV